MEGEVIQCGRPPDVNRHVERKNHLWVEVLGSGVTHREDISLLLLMTTLAQHR